MSGTLLVVLASTAAQADALPASVTAGTAVDPAPAQCGARGLGDPMHPELGTPGVQIGGYDASLRFSRGLRSYRAVTEIAMHTTSTTDCIALDYANGEVASVQIDGDPAAATMRGERLLITPTAPISAGTDLTIEVATETTITAAKDVDPRDFPPGVLRDNGVVQVIGQPSRAHRLLPMADHPTQKAPWRITVDAPKGKQAAVSGHLVRRSESGNRTRTVFRTPSIATHVLQVAVGRLTEVSDGRAHGVRLRSWIRSGEVEATKKARALIPAQLGFLQRRLGRYPFKEYGVLGTRVGGELEQQSLSLFSVAELRRPAEVASVMLHELTHQWFGDSVSVRNWQDLWLAEGHAVYYETLYDNRGQRLAPVFAQVRDQVANQLGTYGPISQPRRRAFEAAALAPYGPVAYQGGAVALYALRQDIGAGQFAKVERTFLRRYRHDKASTENYLRVVQQLAGRPPAQRMRHWLTTTRLPHLPSQSGTRHHP